MPYVPNYTLWFGKHDKAILEQVALSDFAYIKQLSSPGQRFRATPQYQQFSRPTGPEKTTNGPDTVGFIRRIFNRYPAQAGCAESGCSDAATHISLRGNDNEGFNFGNAFIYCTPHARAINGDVKIRVMPISHDTLLQVRSKGDQERLQQFLNHLAGFDGRITKERARGFFHTLVMREANLDDLLLYENGLLSARGKKTWTPADEGYLESASERIAIKMADLPRTELDRYARGSGASVVGGLANPVSDTGSFSDDDSY